MSAPVDVLAVLDALQLQTRQRGGSPSCETIAQARATVAELIEADRELDAAQAHLRQCPAPLSLNESGMVKKAARDSAKARVKAAIARRAAALARLSGGQP